MFKGYRKKGRSPEIVLAERALTACGYEPRQILSGGGSDANALEARGFTCTNLADGSERNHEPGERISTDALEGLLEVTLALVEEAGHGV
jgi:tripeptide aminopeptidase